MGWYFGNLVLLIVLQMLLVIPLHELGHACAAWLVGFRVRRIVLGHGERLWRGQLADVRLELHAIPLMGLTFVAPRTATLVRTRMFITVLAGPLVTLGLALVTMPALRAFFGRRVNFADPFAGLTPIGMLCVGSWIVLAFSLFPRKSNLQEHGQGWTDGAMLLRLPFLDAAARSKLLAANVVSDWREARDVGDHQAARRIIETSHLRDDIPELDSLLGVTLLDLHAYEEARELFLAMLTREIAEPSRALIWNNVAYTDFLIGTPELLAEADDHSGRAMATLASMPAILGTRGTVLIWSGRTAEGIPLLRRAFDQNAEPSARALNACALALGFVACGDPDAAAAWLEIGRTYDPACALLERVAARLRDAPLGATSAA